MSTADPTDDTAQVKHLGYDQELKRQHGKLSLLGMAFNILNTWTALACSFNLALPSGGPSVVLWGLAVAAVCSLCLSASMAEFASVYPVAAGPYYWVAMVAPPEWAASLSWVCGWMNAMAWVFSIGMATAIATIVILQIVTVTNEGYTTESWHLYLVYIALMLACFALNAFGNKLLPLINKVGMCYSLTGFVAIIVTVLSTASPNFSKASFVFGGVVNNTGWPTGLSWMIGLLQGSFALVCYDAAAHMSEEIPNPGKVVPEIMTVSVVIGSVTGFIMCVALLFAAPDMDQVISAPEGPILHILRTCTGSDAGAIVLVMFPLVCLIMSNTGMITSASRLTYAFARDGGLPYSSTLAKVHKGLDVPLNALGLTMAVVTVYGLLFFAGTAAMNALVSGSVVLLGLSYIVPVVVNMASGRRGLPEDRPFRMGNKVAWAANSVGVGYVLLTTVLFCLPPGGPEVEKDTMNYTVITVGAVCIASIADWFVHGKTRYRTPKLASPEYVDGIEAFEAKGTSTGSLGKAEH